jgi:hypothetical protein
MNTSDVIADNTLTTGNLISQLISAQVLVAASLAVIKNRHLSWMHGLKLKRTLNTTFIGPIHNRFDFLGDRFHAQGLIGLTQKNLDNHLNKHLQLYQQNAPDQRVQVYLANKAKWVSVRHLANIQQSEPSLKADCGS